MAILFAYCLSSLNRSCDTSWCPGVNEMQFTQKLRASKQEAGGRDAIASGTGGASRQLCNQKLAKDAKFSNLLFPTVC